MKPFSTTPPSEYKPENFFPRITDEYRSFIRTVLQLEEVKPPYTDYFRKPPHTEPFDVEEPIFNFNFPSIRPLKRGQPFNLASILSSRVGVDHLVRCVSLDGARKVNPTCQISKVTEVENTLQGKDLVLIVCVFVPAKWCECNADKLCQLSLISSDLLSEPRFEIVFVPKMRKRPDLDGYYGVGDFNSFFSAFPGRLSLPCTSTAACDYLCRRFNFKGQLTYVLVSRDRVLDVDAWDNIFRFGSSGYPFTRDRLDQLEFQLPRLPLSELLGVSPSFNLMNLGGSAYTTIAELSEKVVGLYLFRGGENFTVYDQVYNQCRDSNGEESEFEIVFICVPPTPSIHPTVYQEVVFPFSGSSFWYFLPKDYSVCLRLSRLSQNYCDDAMIIVGPRNRYVEPCGGEILTAFGIDAFPFHREEVLKRYLGMLEEVTLESLLCRESVQYVLTHDNMKIPITELQGKNVVLYVDHVEYVNPDIFETVSEWCEEMEKQTTDFVLVYTLLRDSNDESMVETTPFRGTKWLEYPSDVGHSTRLQTHEAFFYEVDWHKPTKPVVGLYPPEVLLFGKDGRLHMIDAEYKMALGGKVNLFDPDYKDLRGLLIRRLTEYLELFNECDG